MDRFAEMTTFARVVRSGSISAAADQLGLAKSAVSRRLKELEARLGVQLLNRTTRTLTLTSAGSAFLEQSEAILKSVEAAEAQASGGRQALEGRIALAAPLSFGLKHLSPVLQAFAERHPDVTLEIDFSDRHVDLVREGFDLAVRVTELDDAELAARPFVQIRHLLAASPEYLRQRGTPAHPKELAGHQWIEYSNTPSTWAYEGPAGHRGEIRPSSTLKANNGEFITRMAAAGFGLTIQPTFILSEALVRGELVEVLPGYRWRTLTAYLVYPRSRYLPQRLRALVDFVAESFDRDQPYWDAAVENAG